MRVQASLCALILALIPEWRSIGSESGLQQTLAYYGLDDDQIKQRSRKDDEGLRGFFLAGLTTDSAAAEEYSDELIRLLEHWGEGFFLKTLDSVGSRVREQVLSNDQIWSHFLARYPRVAGLVVRPTQF